MTNSADVQAPTGQTTSQLLAREGSCPATRSTGPLRPTARDDVVLRTAERQPRIPRYLLPRSQHRSPRFRYLPLLTPRVAVGHRVRWRDHRPSLSVLGAVLGSVQSHE